MPIEIKLEAPLAKSNSTALAFQALSEGARGFQSARQGPSLPSFVLSDEEAEFFGPATTFTPQGKQVLFDKELTRDERNFALETLRGRGQLQQKHVSPQQQFEERTFTINGRLMTQDSSGNFKDITPKEESEKDDSAKRKDLITRAKKRAQSAVDRGETDRDATPEEVMKALRVEIEIDQMAEAVFSGQAPEPQDEIEDLIPELFDVQTLEEEPSGNSFVDKVAAKLLKAITKKTMVNLFKPFQRQEEAPQEEVPKTEKEAEKLAHDKMHEFDEMSPSLRIQTLSEMPPEEQELFLQLLPESVQKRLQEVNDDIDRLEQLKAEFPDAANIEEITAQIGFLKARYLDIIKTADVVSHKKKSVGALRGFGA